MRKLLALFSVLLAFPFGTSPVSAYSLGDCSYSSADGSVISDLVCPDAPFPVSVSGSSVPNADPDSLSGNYFPAVYHSDGVYYVSLRFVLTAVVWFVAVFLFAVAFYHLSVVSFKLGLSVFRRKSRNP